MSTLKMVCMVKNLWKAPSRKNLSKFQKSAKKVSVAEFRDNHWWNLFLRFTVILIMILKLMILWNFIWKLLIQSPVKQLWWSLFVKNLLTCYSSKKVWGAFHHWRYIRRSWLTWYTKTTRWNLGLTPRPHSLSNFKDENINNSLVSR